MEIRPVPSYILFLTFGHMFFVHGIVMDCSSAQGILYVDNTHKGCNRKEKSNTVLDYHHHLLVIIIVFVIV